MMIKQTLVFASVLISSTAAFAQAPPTPATPPAQTAPPQRTAATNCAPTVTNPQQGTLAPRDSTSGQAAEPLGDKLAKSDGVLCPPTGVDSEIHVTPPNASNMPVIPPPGSPGGDQSVRPK